MFYIYIHTIYRYINSNIAMKYEYLLLLCNYCKVQSDYCTRIHVIIALYECNIALEQI